MKKQEALKYIRKKNGYVPYSQLFDIFSNEDEIPEDLINLSINNKINSRASGNYLIVNAEIYENLKEI